MLRMLWALSLRSLTGLQTTAKPNTELCWARGEPGDQKSKQDRTITVSCKKPERMCCTGTRGELGNSQMWTSKISQCQSVKRANVPVPAMWKHNASQHCPVYCIVFFRKFLFADRASRGSKDRLLAMVIASGGFFVILRLHPGPPGLLAR